MLSVKRKSGAVSTTLKFLKNIIQRDVLTAVRKIVAFWNSIMLEESRKERKAKEQMGSWAW